MIDELLMKIVFEEIATIASSVAIVYGKKVRPYTIFFNVESYTDSILIVIPRYSLMSINSIGLDYPVFLRRSLYLLEGWNFMMAAIFFCCQYPAEHCLPLEINSFRKLLAFISPGLDLILPIFASTTEKNICVASLSNFGLDSLF